MTLHQTKSKPLPHTDVQQLSGIDYVEFYVGNAKQAIHFYRTAFGFKPVAFSGFETGVRDRVSFVGEQREIRLMVTEATGSAGVVSDHVKLHGDALRDIALSSSDAARAFDLAIKGGAKPIMEPTFLDDENGRVVQATVAAFGDLVHSFIERESYQGAFLPGYQPLNSKLPVRTIGVKGVDHIAIAVEPGTLLECVEYYIAAHGFHQSRSEDVSAEYSGMNSAVVQNDSGSVIFVLVEPSEGKRRSLIQEYLNYNGGSGVHHVACSTDDIVETVQMLRDNGVEFTTTPGTYYETLEDRVGKIDEDIETLREQNILVDRDANGYLMQIFSRPVQSRPTVFFEIIQRKGADGFGSGNIKALFEAATRDQAMRGNA
jgi:4-hydroxyphenylpyruvate dioxygenase